jgi:hypothetical protein
MQKLYTISMPISGSFKAVIQPIAKAIGSDSMERGTGMLLEHALDFYSDLHPDVGAPQTEFFLNYLKFVNESGLYRHVKGDGKKNRSFRVTADPDRMKYFRRMQNKYSVLDRSRCTRLLLPLGIVIQPIEPLNGFTIEEPFKSLFERIDKMVASHRRSRKNMASQPS